MYKKTMMKLSVLLLATTTVLTACGGNNNNAGSKATDTPASETPSNTPQETKKRLALR